MNDFASFFSSAQFEGLLCEDSSSAGNNNVAYSIYCKHHYKKLENCSFIKRIPPFKPPGYINNNKNNRSLNRLSKKTRETKTPATNMLNGKITKNENKKDPTEPLKRKAENEDDEKDKSQLKRKYVRKKTAAATPTIASVNSNFKDEKNKSTSTKKGRYSSINPDNNSLIKTIKSEPKEDLVHEIGSKNTPLIIKPDLAKEKSSTKLKRKIKTQNDEQLNDTTKLTVNTKNTSSNNTDLNILSSSASSSCSSSFSTSLKKSRRSTIENQHQNPSTTLTPPPSVTDTTSNTISTQNSHDSSVQNLDLSIRVVEENFTINNKHIKMSKKNSTDFKQPDSVTKQCSSKNNKDSLLVQVINNEIEKTTNDQDEINNEDVNESFPETLEELLTKQWKLGHDLVERESKKFDGKFFGFLFSK
jgi:hypothetical protein